MGLLLGLCLVASLITMREVAVGLRIYFDRGSTNWIDRRSKEMVQVLDDLDPKINSTRVAFFGASELVMAVRAADVETALNAKGGAWQVLNLGLFNLDQRTLDIEFRRILQTPAGKAGDWNSIFINFQPTRYTHRFIERTRSKGLMSYERNLYTDQMYWQDFWKAPNSTISNWFTAHFFEGISASVLRGNLSALAFWELKTHKRGLLDNLWNFTTAKTPGFEWSKRGHFYFDVKNLSPETLRALNRLRRPGNQAKLIRSLARLYDGLDYNFDPDLIAAFKRDLREAHKFSKNVFLLYLPPCQALPITVAGRVRLRRTLAELSAVEGVKWIQLKGFEDPKCSDYFDTFHFNEIGQKKLTPLLVEAIQSANSALK